MYRRRRFKQVSNQEQVFTLPKKRVRAGKLRRGSREGEGGRIKKNIEYRSNCSLIETLYGEREEIKERSRCEQQQIEGKRLEEKESVPAEKGKGLNVGKRNIREGRAGEEGKKKYTS
jgi:hypothetical protein